MEADLEIAFWYFISIRGILLIFWMVVARASKTSLRI